jgi:hypothetical protein
MMISASPKKAVNNCFSWCPDSLITFFYFNFNPSFLDESLNLSQISFHRAQLRSSQGEKKRREMDAVDCHTRLVHSGHVITQTINLEGL